MHTPETRDMLQVLLQTQTLEHGWLLREMERRGAALKEVR